MSKARSIQKILKKVGITPEMIYADVGKDVLPSATMTRYPAPNSQKLANYPSNFPTKSDRLAKFSYHNDRRAILQEEAGIKTSETTPIEETDWKSWTADDIRPTNYLSPWAAQFTKEEFTDIDKQYKK